MLTLTIGFTFENKPVCLYVGESFAAAEFAEKVALQSKAYHRVKICRDPIPEKICDHESIPV
jgi:hypothetical protein